MTELNTENNTSEVSDMEDTEVVNTTPLEEPTEPESEPNPETEDPVESEPNPETEDPEEPTETVEPEESTEPELNQETEEPIDPTEPTESETNQEPTDPTEPVETTESTDPVEPVETESNPEIEEPSIPDLSEEEYVCPWADAPENTIYYSKMYDDGHLGSYTESAMMAYKFGYFNNRVSKDDVEVSEVNGLMYLKDRCPHKTQEQLQQEEITQRITEIQIAVQNLLDSKAKEKLYDNGFAIASYATSTVEKFRNEASSFIAWRDACWTKCYEILALFQNGEIPMPTVEEVMLQLPTLEW